MARKKGGRTKGKSRKGAAEVQYHPDDPRSFSDLPVPDKNSSEFYEDAVDEFHAQRDKILLDGAATIQEDSCEEEGQALLPDSDSEQQYYLSDSEIQQFEGAVQRYEKEQWKKSMQDDFEDMDEQQDKDDVKDKSWGKKRNIFYGDDHQEGRFDLEVDEQEEEEAVRLLQKRMTEMTEDDFVDLSHMLPAKHSEKSQETKTEKPTIQLDISKIPVSEQVKVLRKESPEVFGLYEELKKSRTELCERVEPVLQLVADGVLSDSDAAAMMRAKQRALKLYCCNLAFYFVLKTSHTPLLDHPVMERILYFKRLLSELDAVEPTEELDTVLDCVRAGHDLSSLLQAAHTDTRKKKKQKKKSKTTKEVPSQKPATETEEGMELAEGSAAEEARVSEDDEKRPIDYEMEKNKGLTAKRKKELRNPRVKHRLKFRKAKIRRKGQVREVRAAIKPYGGEMSGIRAGIIRSTKFKY